MSDPASEATGIVPDGRYPRRTPERADAIAAVLRIGVSRTAAAVHAGLDQNTFWRWMKADAAFVRLVEKAEAEAEMAYVTKIHQAAQHPANWRAAARWLERRRYAAWGRGRRVNGVAVEAEPETIDSEQRERGIVRDRRYPRRTPERAIAIATALRAGATRAAAMRHAGLDQNTLWRWMKADAAFARLVEEAEAEAEMACVTTIHRAAQDPAMWQSAKWWLERRLPAEFRRRRRSDSKLSAAVERVAAVEGLDAAELLTELEHVAAEKGLHAGEQLAELECVLGEQREHDRQVRHARRSMDERVSHPDLAVGPSGPGMKLAAFRSALMAGATRKAAAGSAGIDPTTLWRWVNEDPEMAALIEQAEASAAVYFVSRVNDAAQGIWQAAAFLLERKWPSEFARRTKLDASIETLRLAESIAEEAGLDAEELIAEAETIRVDHAKRMRQEPE